MRKALAAALAALVVGVSCATPVRAQELAKGGVGVANALDSSSWAFLARIASEIGGPAGTLATAIWLMHEDPDTGEQLINAVLGTALTVETLKIGFGRARPYVEGENGRFTGFTLSGDYHSMPSGHAANAFAMATVLAKKYPNWAPALFSMASAVGLSRIELNMHWPTDVIVGSFIGVVIGDQVSEGRLKLVDVTP